MGFKLLGDAICVKRIEKQKKQTLILISKEDEKIFTGEVFKTGPGMQMNNGSLSKMDVKIGDKVMYTSTVGFNVEDPYTKDNYTILFQKDIICILEDEVKDQ